MHANAQSISALRELPVILLYPLNTSIATIQLCVLPKLPRPPFILCDPHIRYGYSMEIDWHMLWIIPSRSSSSILL